MQGHKIYVAGYTTPSSSALDYAHVFVYNITSNLWDRLPDVGQYYGVPHIIGGKLCIIGGYLCTTYKRTNRIRTFDEAAYSWTSHYPDLLSARSRPGVVTHLEHVIVAGGQTDSGDNNHIVLDVIEVLNWIKNSQWRKVSVRLPRPMFDLKMTTSGEDIFIVGYGNRERMWEKCIFKIAINAVTISNGKQASWDQVTPEFQWNTTPLPNSSPLLVIGGNNDHQTTADIKMYNATSKEWKKVDSLTFSRTLPAVAMVGDNAIFIMGGYTDVDLSSSTVVEMGQVELL